MLTLYQFPISHFCEKVRWALDYKGVDYKLVNLLPGEHVKKLRAIAAKTEVPVIQLDNEVIQGSADIISWLDQRYPETPLTPAGAEEKKQAQEWEAYVDETIGPTIRLYFYHYLLGENALILPILAQGQPLHKRLWFRLIYPRVRSVMRKFMKLDDRTARISLKIMQRSINKLSEHYEQHEFLVGDTFTRADLAAAALLAPMISPPQYGVDWPEQYPLPLQQTIDTLRERLTWVERLYRLYR